MWRNNTEWGDDDRLLALAHTLYEDTLCKQCGYPLAVCRDPSTDFEVTEHTCQATAAVEAHRRAQPGDTDPGVVLVPVVDDTPSVYGGPPPGWTD